VGDTERGGEALRAEKPWNWETESGERLRLVRALKAAARRVSDAEGSGLFARAVRERVWIVLDIDGCELVQD